MWVAPCSRKSATRLWRSPRTAPTSRPSVRSRGARRKASEDLELTIDEEEFRHRSPHAGADDLGTVRTATASTSTIIPGMSSCDECTVELAGMRSRNASARAALYSS